MIVLQSLFPVGVVSPILAVSTLKKINSYPENFSIGVRCGGYKRHSEGVETIIFVLLKVGAVICGCMRSYANVCEWDDMIRYD